jgi:AbiJ N-terminal domain 4
MLFSERKGFTNLQKIIQIDSMDTDLLYGLWSGVQLCIFDNHYTRRNFKTTRGSNLDRLYVNLWHNFFKLPVDNLPEFHNSAVGAIRKKYMKYKWYEVYDFIEFIYKNSPLEFQDEFRKFCNSVLERENSAYRFVDQEVVEISSPVEIESIEEAIVISSKFGGVQEHLKTALVHLSNRESPDYRNSIKESISAVEAISIIVSENPKATLGSALKIIEEAGNIHPALKKSLSALYGYTSDGDGIRHAMLDESDLSYTDAKFMLVSCTCFINYFIGKMSDLGLH